MTVIKNKHRGRWYIRESAEINTHSYGEGDPAGVLRVGSPAAGQGVAPGLVGRPGALPQSPRVSRH